MRRREQHAEANLVYGSTHIRFLSRVGDGPFGVVYRGEWNTQAPQATEEVCVKLVRPQYLQHYGSEGLERLKRAVAIYRQYSLPNMVSPYGLFEDQKSGWFGFVQPLVGGYKFVPSWMAQHMTVEQISRLFLSFASALSTLHRYGGVHGNLKPTNIVLGASTSPDSYEPQILDLVWTSLGVAAPDAQEGLQYLAPEQWGQAAPTPFSDQWAWGVMLGSILQQAPGRFQHLYPVMQRATQPNPEHRYASMDTLVEALQAQLTQQASFGPVVRAPFGAESTPSSLSAPFHRDDLSLLVDEQAIASERARPRMP